MKNHCWKYIWNSSACYSMDSWSRINWLNILPGILKEKLTKSTTRQHFPQRLFKKLCLNSLLVVFLSETHVFQELGVNLEKRIRLNVYTYALKRWETLLFGSVNTVAVVFTVYQVKMLNLTTYSGGGYCDSCSWPLLRKVVPIFSVSARSDRPTVINKSENILQMT